MKKALTIAGSDSSGGAGIQADLKTMTMNGVYAMSAITALTAQNTTGVSGIMEVTPEFLSLELDAVFTDIYPDAVKTGMVSSSELIHTIVNSLKKYHAKNIVVDPVMVATSGAKLISDDAIETLKKELLPIATVITPNIPDAEVLSDIKINNEEDMITAARIIYEKYGCNVLCKGGHQINDANDLLYRDGSYIWFKGKRINNNNTHGTGCTLSSAIASFLAREESLDEAVKHAKDYISKALEAQLEEQKPVVEKFDTVSKAFNLNLEAEDFDAMLEDAKETLVKEAGGGATPEELKSLRREVTKFQRDIASKDKQVAELTEQLNTEKTHRINGVKREAINKALVEHNVIKPSQFVDMFMNRVNVDKDEATVTMTDGAGNELSVSDAIADWAKENPEFVKKDVTGGLGTGSNGKGGSKDSNGVSALMQSVIDSQTNGNSEGGKSLGDIFG